MSTQLSSSPTHRLVHPGRLHALLTSFHTWGPLMHILCLGAIFTGVTYRALLLGISLYWIRMFGMTAGYHRYFAHRAYRTSRWFQFLLGILGTLGLERGPLWWSATHRKHHKHSDQPGDPHSPVQKGFWYAHWGWVTDLGQMETDVQAVKDLYRYPELRWLDTYHWFFPLLAGLGCYLVAGWSGVIVGAFWSTIALWHGTFCINSLAHIWGSRRYPTQDDSRNNFWLALLTLGEGWHNNHHRYMNSARQGFFWWEIDVSYYVLKTFAALGLVWDLKRPPVQVYEAESGR